MALKEGSGPMKSKVRSLATSRRGMTFTGEVEAVLRRLTSREQHVLRLRFGKAKQDIDGVAARLALTPTAVHRIQWSALHKLWLTAVVEAVHSPAKAG